MGAESQGNEKEEEQALRTWIDGIIGWEPWEKELLKANIGYPGYREISLTIMNFAGSEHERGVLLEELRRNVRALKEDI